MYRIPFTFLLLPAAVLAQDRARLLGVRAGGDAVASSIELIGDRPLSFTTLKLAGPPRVVVDLADTEVAPEAREVAVDDGTVKRVAAAAAGQRTARVVIELAADAEFDVRAHGSSLEVRIPRPAPLVAADEPPAAALPPPEEKPEPAPVPAPPANVAAQPKPDPAAEKRRLREAAQREAAEKAAAAKQAALARRLAAEQKAAAAKKARALAAAEKAAAAAPKKAPPERKIAMVQRHSITGIGFRPIQGGEVIVRSDHPLEYGVSGDDKTLLLHLPSAGIPLPNNRRPLDTHYFGGPVQRVVPLAKENGTDVRIELSGHADYQLAQSGTVLTVTFSSPR